MSEISNLTGDDPGRRWGQTMREDEMLIKKPNALNWDKITTTTGDCSWLEPLLYRYQFKKWNYPGASTISAYLSRVYSSKDEQLPLDHEQNPSPQPNHIGWSRGGRSFQLRCDSIYAHSFILVRSEFDHLVTFDNRAIILLMGSVGGILLVGHPMFELQRRYLVL